jgi:NADH dehydrogenase
VPGVAPAAIQMGVHAAANIRRALAGLPLAPFRYRDKGSLATIGRSRAVAVIGRCRLSGFVAWLAWLGIHIFFLIGFRNRLVVMFTWFCVSDVAARTPGLSLTDGGRQAS